MVEAADGLEALIQAKRLQPHYVVLDVMMPRLGGLGALESQLFAGYDCATNDGVEALQRIRDDPPAVVLLDINMPRLGGIEALKTIRAIDAEAKVIMVSGIAAVEQARLTPGVRRIRLCPEARRFPVPDARPRSGVRREESLTVPVRVGARSGWPRLSGGRPRKTVW